MIPAPFSGGARTIHGSRPRLSATASTAIGDAGHQVFVSAACLWELATKIGLGTLTFPQPLSGSLLDEVEAERFRALAITAIHAERAGSIAHVHRDPFDRMIIAQALTEDLVLVSNETLFDSFGLRRIW